MSARPQAVDLEASPDVDTGTLTPPLPFFVSTPKELTASSRSPRCTGGASDVDPEDSHLDTAAKIELLREEVDLIEEEESVFEAPDVSLHAMEGEPTATCIRSVFHNVNFGTLMWQREEVDSPTADHRDLRAYEGTAKLPNVREEHCRPCYFQSSSSQDGESHTTASVQLDPEATDSALSTNSSHCDVQSGGGCRAADIEAHQKIEVDDLPLADASSSSSSKVLWSHLSHERPRGDYSVLRGDSPRATGTKPLTGLEIERGTEAPLTAESVVVEGMRSERRERQRPRLPGLRAPKADGPPMSPRAPFCAARGFFQTDGFLFSDLDLPGDMSGESEGGFSRSNSMSGDCSISRLNSIAVSVADEAQESNCRRAAHRACTNSQGSPRLANLAERLANIASPNGAPPASRLDSCTIGYRSARIGDAKGPGHVRNLYETAAAAAETASRRSASPWPVADVSKSPLQSSLGDQIVHMWRETTAQIAEVMTTYTSSNEPFQRNV